MNKYTHAIDALPIKQDRGDLTNPAYIGWTDICIVNNKLCDEIIARNDELFESNYRHTLNEEYTNFRITLLALIANMSDKDLIELELI